MVFQDIDRVDLVLAIRSNKKKVENLSSLPLNLFVLTIT